MAVNLLAKLHKLTDEDRENIALAMRCCGPEKNSLKDFPDYLKAAAAIDTIGLLKRKEVIAALRKTAYFYQPAHDTIRKLQSK
jgi:hypothetical protein